MTNNPGDPDRQLVKEWFTYHAPADDQPERYRNITEAGEALCNAILDNAPRCPDRTVALRTVREARMWANAAIALEHTLKA